VGIVRATGCAPFGGSFSFRRKDETGFGPAESLDPGAARIVIAAADGCTAILQPLISLR